MSTDLEVSKEIELVPEEKRISSEAFVKAPARMVRIFCRYFIENGFQNGADAARRAGSTAKNPNQVAYQWLQDPWVVREIERAKELLTRGENPLELIREEEVIAKLSELYENSLEDKNYLTALKAVELMGKQIGMFQGEKSGLPRKTKETNLIEQNMDDERLQELTKALQATNKITKEEK